MSVTVLVASAVAAYPAVSAGRISWLVPAIGAFGMSLLGLALGTRSSCLLACAVGVLGVEYATWLALEGGGRDLGALPFSVGLALVAELGYETREPRLGPVEAHVIRDRGGSLAVVLLVSAALGTAVLGLASLSNGGGVTRTGAGVGAAVLAVSLLASLVVRGGRAEARLLGGRR